MSCASLLAASLAGMPLDQLDKTKVYEIPSSYVSQMTTTQLVAAKICAVRYGLRYRIVNG